MSGFVAAAEEAIPSPTAPLSETCEPDLPLVVTNVRTTPAPEPDLQALTPIRAALVASEVAAGTHLV